MLPQYSRTHPVLILFILASVALFVAGVATLFFAPITIGLTCILIPLLFIMATRRSTARRYLVADFFRIPRAPRLSELLLFHRRRLQLINFGAVLIIVLAFNPVDAGLWEWLGLMAVCAVGGPLLAAAVKMHLKFGIDSGFRIVVFRRYEGELSVRHKARVLPICGFYGQVLLFEDDKLSDGWEGGWQRMDHWVFAELYQPLAAPRKSEAWRELVCEQLVYADFVLFDWSGEVTANLVWELERALERVPVERIMILRSPESAAAVDAVLHRLNRSGDLADALVSAPFSPMGEALFISRFVRRMRELRPLPRPHGQLAGPSSIPEGGRTSR